MARGCGFAALAIACTLIGFAHDPAALLRASALMVTGLAVVLYFQATRARGRPYKRTETWLMLDPADRPPAEIAQRAVGIALEDVYHRFARVAGSVALFLWVTLFAARIAFWLQP